MHQLRGSAIPAGHAQNPLSDFDEIFVCYEFLGQFCWAKCEDYSQNRENFETLVEKCRSFTPLQFNLHDHRNTLQISSKQEIRFVELGVCPMQLFSFLITWRSFSSKSAAVYKISWKWDDFFTEIWRYIDFQNGCSPPSWNCFTTIRDHPRILCCWSQLPVKFHVNLIHKSEDIAIWIFSHIWLEMPIRPPKMGVSGDFGPLNVIVHHLDPKRHILA